MCIRDRLWGVGDGNGHDLSFDIIINGTTVFRLELVKSRDGQVRKLKLTVWTHMFIVLITLEFKDYFFYYCNIRLWLLLNCNPYLESERKVVYFLWFWQVKLLKDLGKLVIILYEAQSPTLTGDVKMKFYSSNPVGLDNTCGCTTFECQLFFHFLILLFPSNTNPLLTFPSPECSLWIW